MAVLDYYHLVKIVQNDFWVCLIFKDKFYIFYIGLNSKMLTCVKEQ